MRDWVRTHGWILGVLAVASFAMLFRLGARPIENWDEGIHGVVSLEMVERGDWVTPWYAGGTYFRKPPLKLWLSAGLFDAFGVNAWTLRLPNAVAGILTSLLVAWWMWEWRRSRLEAFLAGAIVATMRPIFFHAFRTGEMDGMLTFFVTAALYGWWKATTFASFRAERSRADARENEAEESRSRSLNSLRSLGMTHMSGGWFALCGAVIGFAIMTKSAAGLLPLPIIAAHWLLNRRTIRIPLRVLCSSVLVFSIVVLPWHLAMTVLHGATFWNDYFGWHVVKRATEVLHNETAGVWWWYFPTFARRFTPYTYWFMPALLSMFILSGAEAKRRISQSRKDLTLSTASRIGEILRRFTPQDTLGQLLLLWFLIGFALFTLARTKFDWYLLPLYPAAVMLTVRFFATARHVLTNRWIAALHLVAIATFVLALPALFPPGTITDRIIEQWYARFGHQLVLTAIMIATVSGITVAAYHRWSASAAGRATYAMILSLVLIPGLTVTARHLRAHEPESPFPAIAETVRGGSTLVSYGIDYKQLPAGYFILRSELRNDVRVLDGQSDVARTTAMLHERERGFLLTKRETELPEELRQTVGEPRTFGEFALWTRH